VILNHSSLLKIPCPNDERAASNKKGKRKQSQSSNVPNSQTSMEIQSKKP
jgi:hypothetical protein